MLDDAAELGGMGGIEGAGDGRRAHGLHGGMIIPAAAE
jgi:hypothetical protein